VVVVYIVLIGVTLRCSYLDQKCRKRAGQRRDCVVNCNVSFTVLLYISNYQRLSKSSCYHML